MRNDVFVNTCVFAAKKMHLLPDYANRYQGRIGFEILSMFDLPDFEEECYYENISDKEESYLKNLIKDHLNEEMKFQNFLKDSEVCDELKLQFESEDIILC